MISCRRKTGRRKTGRRGYSGFFFELAGKRGHGRCCRGCRRCAKPPRTRRSKSARPQERHCKRLPAPRPFSALSGREKRCTTYRPGTPVRSGWWLRLIVGTIRGGGAATTLRGRTDHGIVVFQNGAALADGTLVGVAALKAEAGTRRLCWKGWRSLIRKSRSIGKVAGTSCRQNRGACPQVSERVLCEYGPPNHKHQSGRRGGSTRSYQPATSVGFVSGLGCLLDWGDPGRTRGEGARFPHLPKYRSLDPQ
jgi:hypothetical protein